ncbi:MAG: MBL fold metallo-hydrolase [Tannerella sp.]|jgi:glyoxylase-like metal-dependent hydrolase (beta-lactamase superfamily II)|nr:MBL fold metallo-hydrolase [Tannerella sp.]
MKKECLDIELKIGGRQTQTLNFESRISNVETGMLFVLLLLLILPAGHLKAQERRENVITFDIDFESLAITLLSEGQGQGSIDILAGATEEMLKQTIPDGAFPNAVNAFLVEMGSKTILFDAGYGRELFDNLEAYGKTVADIDAIMLTHMHGDHIGGLLRNNKKSFPAATLYIPKPEYDYWMSDEAMRKQPESRRGGFIDARNVIDAYKDNLRLFVPGTIDETDELLPGIRSIAAYGHTPGHTGYMLESNGSKIFIWGDLTHAMAIQTLYPEVAVTYDLDPAQAVKSRRQLLEYLSEEKIRIAGMHIQFPAIGDVRKNKANGYDFILMCDCEGR